MGTKEQVMQRVFAMNFSFIHKCYVEKAENKGRTKEEVNEILMWLTNYSQKELKDHLKNETDCETFIKEAKLNPRRKLITGVVCGVRVEEVENKTMRELRYMDKLIDELAKGKTMEKILRKE